MNHGDLPGPNVEQLFDSDAELYLAGGPLAPDLCECEALCECEGEGEWNLTPSS